MKDTTTTAGTEKLPDFSKINLNDWRHANTLTSSVIFAFLSFLRGIMLWLETDGKNLLERKEPLSFEEWGKLYDNSWLLCARLGYSQRAISQLHMMVLKKGIASLIHWTHTVRGDSDNWSEDNKYVFGRWLSLVQSDVQEGTTFGLGSHYCKKEESWELVESLVPIAQILKSEPLLESFACDRFSGDKKAEELFVKTHKNW